MRRSETHPAAALNNSSSRGKLLSPDLHDRKCRACGKTLRSIRLAGRSSQLAGFGTHISKGSAETPGWLNEYADPCGYFVYRLLLRNYVTSCIGVLGIDSTIGPFLAVVGRNGSTYDLEASRSTGMNTIFYTQSQIYTYWIHSSRN